MKNRVLAYKGFSIDVAGDWDDITSTLEIADVPLTVGDPVSGVGALQFSPAIYTSGPLPHITPKTLCELLDDFISKKGLGKSFERRSYQGKVAIETASFHAADSLIQVWYVSDGKSMMLVTYVCEWDYRDQEVSEREKTVRSISFGT